MAAFLTKTEVVTLAFTRGVDTKKIEDGLIESIQEKHIRPILGNDFFEAVLATPGDYSTLLTYLKNVIAWYVRYYILPDVYLDISSTGVSQIQGRGRTNATGTQVSRAQDHALETVRLHINRLTQYLNDNSDDYPNYFLAGNADNRITIAGGIIFEDDSRLTEDDDYTQFLI